jgi:hypothetical protein
MGGRGSGRRPKYSQAVHETVIKKLKTGAFLKHAAEAAGVSVDAVNDWLARGEAGDKRYEQFYLDVRTEQAEDACRSHACITTAMVKHHAGDWKAAAWNLERKYPKLYGPAAMPSVGVTFGGGVGAGGEYDGQQRTRVEFYFPDNCRRPWEGDEG